MLGRVWVDSISCISSDSKEIRSRITNQGVIKYENI